MPPCQPAMPVPATTAAYRPAISSGSIVVMVLACTMRSVAAMTSTSA
ncbi:hypothetical protein BC477_10550 [Clavibacter michiganensis subsp. michiganensis]|uniref:Uncharacterized protein n=1 Tax=Clavibacter michiganensis subsp. michiganensis TaxID=33013 RepID=A0A251XP11_CLAMM|nr:hypothetical protein BC477_10550 [Clavibacter michiganensis subsp. michiganensis]OUE05166.1 hypothetical protein CMMCAS07_09470 [Clavibacter michiganensis subsp. michiganensis]